MTTLKTTLFLTLIGSTILLTQIVLVANAIFDSSLFFYVKIVNYCFTAILIFVSIFFIKKNIHLSLWQIIKVGVFSFFLISFITKLIVVFFISAEVEAPLIHLLSMVLFHGSLVLSLLPPFVTSLAVSWWVVILFPINPYVLSFFIMVIELAVYCGLIVLFLFAIPRFRKDQTLIFK